LDAKGLSQRQQIVIPRHNDLRPGSQGAGQIRIVVWVAASLFAQWRSPRMSTSARYEILLPLRFNEDQAVPDALISDTLLELENHFGAISWETQV
jgi:hypothetical protein